MHRTFSSASVLQQEAVSRPKRQAINMNRDFTHLRSETVPRTP
jgi:hypothetical protein